MPLELYSKNLDFKNKKKSCLPDAHIKDQSKQAVVYIVILGDRLKLVYCKDTGKRKGSRKR